VALVRDINPTPGQGSSPFSTVRLGSIVIFAADDGTNGTELWRSDGTAAGTTMVKDINPGMDENPPDPDSSDPGKLTVVGGAVYFLANDGVTGNELWRTDGTTTGTTLVKDINPGADDDPPSPDSSSIDQITGVNGTAFLRADDGTNGIELWKSDGTEPGTQIMNGPSGINPAASSSPTHLTAFGTTLFFTADDGSTGFELWKSESPHASAVQVANINPAGGNSVPLFMAGYNGSLFFRADDGSTGAELWKSDPPFTSASMVKDINQTPSSASSDPGFLTVSGGTLFFQAFDGVTGFPSELWKSNGTTAGTQLVADLNQAMGSGSSPFGLTDVGGTLFFYATDSTAGLEPWKSNGGPLGGGTDRIADIRSGLPGSNPLFFNPRFGILGTDAIFDADDGVNGRELWITNGGPLGGGTRMLANINPGGAHAVPRAFATVDNTLFFTANDGTNGEELWRTTIEAAPPPALSPPSATKKCKKGRKLKKGKCVKKKRKKKK
jgi:ELWxxDGT repeat protein